MPFIRILDAEGRKRCSACREWKSIDCFGPNVKGGRYLDSRCHPCMARIRRETRPSKNAARAYRFPFGITPQMHNELDETTLAYIAGLIDGEGCISSSHPKANTKPLSVVVTMIHKPTVEWLWLTCGGTMIPRRVKNPKARMAWTWTLKGARSFSLLQRLLPFMRTKREEAETAIELGRTLWSINVRGRVTEPVLAERRLLGQRLRDLKRAEWLS